MPSSPASIATAHGFSPAIFREYDIRGVFGASLREEDAYFIARAFATRAARALLESVGGTKPTICMGRDGRLSSPQLADAVCRGLLDSGADVVDIGLGPTPMLYFAAKTLGATAGIMVTGSHNPPDHNGFKFVLQNAAFYGADIQGLRALAESGDLNTGARGTRTAKDIKKSYLDALITAYAGEENLRCAWDAGNGAAGEIMSLLIDKLAGQHIALNAAIDGTFPAHHPDPTVPKNLEQLISTVRSQRCDLGIAFDGDGDRIGVVDDEGEILWGDQLIVLLAAEILKERPGATIIADVKASGVLFEEITRMGGNALMWKTGHSLIKSKMAETGAPLAGEMSGHIFFADKYYGFDDALYAAVRVLSMLSCSGKKLSDLRKNLPKRINTPELRFACPDTRKFDVIAEVKSRLTTAGALFSDVDGVRVTTKDGWWLLRASNTQAVLVARCEAATETGLAALKEDLRNQLALSSVSLP
ncbi:MAG: phosphomannomutase/phosphoglucomutase [Alphaproteobacteria bacterium]|nr:phosphomannomutase/phosphoglucomutase [Alphaproteobacteria bacterium]